MTDSEVAALVKSTGESSRGHKETLAVMLQQAKTHMEKTGMLIGFGGVETLYRQLSSTLSLLEEWFDLDAPALRDAAEREPKT